MQCQGTETPNRKAVKQASKLGATKTTETRTIDDDTGFSTITNMNTEYGRGPTNIKLIRDNVWQVMMGKATQGDCPVCGGGPINKGDNAGFECAHIDPTRKMKNLISCQWKALKKYI
jgi:hypothetical protein